MLLIMVAAGVPASADELVVGALRDQDGGVVAGARVEALDGHGTVVSRGRSGTDGTFALTTPARPSTLLVTADDAEPLRLSVPADGDVAGILRRHRSADRVPSVADVAALPAATLGEVGTMIPYWIAFPNALGDRWLARGRGVTSIEGLPFYRRSDGADASTLLPAHAIGSVSVSDPLQGSWYGDRGGGGVIDGRLFDRLDTARATNRDAVLAVGRDPSAIVATSWDGDGTRRVAAARGTAALGPITGSLVALAGDAPNGIYDGVGTTLRASTRTLDLAAGLALTRSASSTSSVPDVGSVVSATFDAAGRSANAFAVRVRWRDDRGVLGSIDSDHRDAAIVIGTTRGDAVRVNASVALAYGADRVAADATHEGRYSATALLPSISADAGLGTSWTVHAGLGDSTLGTPGIPIARASLGEAGLSYSDHRRVRLDLLAYAEGDDTPTAVTRGLAATLGWEIAPRLSLRAWSLRDSDVLSRSAPPYPGGPITQIGLQRPFRRDLVWLTWDGPTRFDVMVRAGALEGNVRVPLGLRYALTVGSARRLATGMRQFTIGVTAR